MDRAAFMQRTAALQQKAHFLNPSFFILRGVTLFRFLVAAGVDC
jgi:hypothetical protein